MQVHPKKSRQAHSQISPVGTPAAASDLPQPNPPTPDCDLRGHQLASRRSGGASQPFPVQWATPDDYLRRFDGPARHVTTGPEPGSKFIRYLIIGLAAALLWLGILWLVGAL